MEKRNRHGALWSESDEENKVIGFVQAHTIEEAAEQAILLRAYGADEIVYDIQELDEAYQSNDTIVYVEDGIVKVKPY